MSILILGVMIGGLVVLHRLGLLSAIPLSWEMVWTIFLNILLVLGLLGFVSKAWSIVVVVGHLNPKFLVSPSRDPLIDIVSMFVLGLALYGVWRRRKWGAYLIFVRLAFTLIIQVFVYHSLRWHLARGYSGADNVYADLSGAATWLLAFNRTWAQFR